jgi:hypothetical protein
MKDLQDRQLRLNKNEITAIIDTLKAHLNDKSKKARLVSMRALANLAYADVQLRPQVIAVLAEVAQTGSPTMQTEGRKLLSSLQKL